MGMSWRAMLINWQQLEQKEGLGEKQVFITEIGGRVGGAERKRQKIGYQKIEARLPV